MMNNNNNHQNFSCEFSPEIVEFLYGEMNVNRQNAFNLHLDKCSDCAGEVFDFSEINLSIRDWKASEFDKLPTPEILIPYGKPVFKQVETEKSLTTFQTLKRYFSFSPVFSGATAVVIAALLLAVGLFMLNGKDKDLIAENNSKPKTEPTASVPVSAQTADPIGEPKIDNLKLESKLKNDVTKNDKSTSPNLLPGQTEIKAAARRKERTDKSSEKKITAAENSTFAGKSKNIPSKKKSQLDELPEDDEDKSLRLADMFAELETR